MKFVDEARIEVMAGKGGNGAASFRREKFIPRGGPDGGDGGRGGSIHAVADRNVNTLIDFRYARKHVARNGENGRGSDQYGKAADDIWLRMPVGTQIFDDETGELLADLTHHQQVVTLARGGNGGWGNLHFKTSTNRAPKFALPGLEGEQRMLRLELKVLADVGLLGMPNAGKSTFIAQVSNARPKIADYPFTTLHPNLGVVRVDVEKSFVIADIPGLIEGASEGAGLGHQFLRHLQRTRLLLHIVDLSPFDDTRDPVIEARAIVKELKKYDPELAAKPRWLVLNKLDTIEPELREKAVKAFLRRYRWTGPVYAIAGLTGEGCRDLCFAIHDHLVKVREAELPPELDVRFDRTPSPMPPGVTELAQAGFVLDEAGQPVRAADVLSEVADAVASAQRASGEAGSAGGSQAEAPLQPVRPPQADDAVTPPVVPGAGKGRTARGRNAR